MGIASLIRKLRDYFHDVERSREDLADSVSTENALPKLPPIPPDAGAGSKSHQRD
jgi:hypothetical protein